MLPLRGLNLGNPPCCHVLRNCRGDKTPLELFWSASGIEKPPCDDDWITQSLCQIECSSAICSDVMLVRAPFDSSVDVTDAR